MHQDFQTDNGFVHTALSQIQTSTQTHRVHAQVLCLHRINQNCRYMVGENQVYKNHCEALV